MGGGQADRDVRDGEADEPRLAVDGVPAAAARISALRPSRETAIGWMKTRASGPISTGATPRRLNSRPNAYAALSAPKTMSAASEELSKAT